SNFCNALLAEKFRQPPQTYLISASLNANEEFRRLGRDEVDVLNACLNAKLPVNETEEVFDVCQAIQVMNQRAKDEGRRQGQEEGRMEALVRTVKNLMKNGKVSAEQAMDILDIAQCDRRRFCQSCKCSGGKIHLPPDACGVRWGIFSAMRKTKNSGQGGTGNGDDFGHRRREQQYRARVYAGGGPAFHCPGAHRSGENRGRVRPGASQPV
ncbi:MAG: hypothetical protein LUD69_05625, partial [Oscillospiraceae bacterium]|nr:hypothetical protein [Oscillospiraceae bacterium]